MYAYNREEETSSTIDLTPGSIAPEISGVIGASKDGSAVYFVGSGALTGTQQNSAGEKAEPNAHNLYSWTEGEGLRFIAILSNLDESDWGPPSELTASLTPDGNHLAFESVETTALSGYDNLRFAPGEPKAGCQRGVEIPVLEGDPHCSEVYLYDADTHDLTCVSCNPSGARPSGPADVPSWSNPFEGPRYLSDDGSRVFFESPDPLAASDQNGLRDVYEFERVGSHSCVAQSSAFVPATSGCLFLISSGSSSDESYFVDASADGRDAFFTTRSPLVGWDRNGDFDVYDAREGGGLPGPQPGSQPCEGESCKPPPSSAPSAPSAATPSFEGPANEKPRKGKRKHHKHKGHHKKKPVGRKRKAGR
jgi:hypothetical protein